MVDFSMMFRLYNTETFKVQAPKVLELLLNAMIKRDSQ